MIGTNQPAAPGLSALHYADDDALRTHQLLSDAGVFSLALVRLDDRSGALHPAWKAFGPPRRADVERAFELVRERLRSARAGGLWVEFMLFYSGHGDVDQGEGFLTLEDQRLTRSRLYELLRGLEADRNHVIIDACRSYYMAYDRGAGGRREPFMGKPFVTAQPSRLPNTGFVLSTSSDRESHEWARYEGGILSHELRSGLRGAADVDLDGRVSYLELAAFLHQANRAIENPRFRPDFMVRAPDDDFERALLAWPRDHAALSVRTPGWGHFYITTADGDRVLDAHPAEGQAVVLRAPTSRPLYVLRNDETGQQVVTAPGSLELDAPASVTPTTMARSGPIEVALEKLFTAPFHARDVRAYRTNGISSAKLQLQDPKAGAARQARDTTAWFESPWLWLGVGAAVLGAAAVTGVIASGQQTDAETSRYGGTAGVSIGAR